jgi:hypothetical protein
MEIPEFCALDGAAVDRRLLYRQGPALYCCNDIIVNLLFMGFAGRLGSALVVWQAVEHCQSRTTAVV